jgi:FkbM family methyltransferase
MNRYVNLQTEKKALEYLAERILECQASYPLFLDNKLNVAVDVGANVGGFIVHAYENFNKIYAFEPVSENYNVINRLIKTYNIKNVELYNTAVYGESNQELPLYCPSERNSGDVSCAVFDHEKWSYQDVGDVCKTISLSDLMSSLDIDQIDYLKMDCEGSEYEIFENFDDYDRIKVIALELHGFYSDSRRRSLVQKLMHHYFFVDLHIDDPLVTTLGDLVSNSPQNLEELMNKSNLLLVNKKTLKL